MTYDQKRSAYQSLLGQIQALEKQQKTVDIELTKITSQKKNALITIEQLEKKLNTDNSEAIKKLQEEKKTTVVQQENIVATLPLQELNISSVYELNTYISELTQK
ncbi:hypothetical protein KBC03_03110 [Patescibacteria group bacterium]|nr:hypothetical protein [Patescibacteria group bacterium]